MTIIDARSTTPDTAADSLPEPILPSAGERIEPVTFSAIEMFLDGRIDAATVESVIAEPPWGPIGREVFERTYLRDIVHPDTDEVLGKESWAETVKRVVLGNLGFAPAEAAWPDEAVELFDLFHRMHSIPAGRHLWVTGTASSKLSRNCWVSGWDQKLSAHFAFLAARLFEGGGVGANYSRDLLSVTSPVTGRVTVRVMCHPGHPDFADVADAAGDALIFLNEAAVLVDAGAQVIQVADTREGWTDAYSQVIDAATVAGDTALIFDVSPVREHGAILRTFGGKASGPAPLVTALVNIADILVAASDDAVDAPRRITGLEGMRIDHEIAASVVAGGARRSARLAAMHWADPDIFEFVSCKADSASHWSANISVEIDEAFEVALDANDLHAHLVLNAVAAGMVANGEPGFIDTELASADEPRRLRICNPCGESFLDTGGFGNGAEGESCNLGSVNLDAFGTDHAGATRAFALMARFLYRATLNQHPDDEVGRLEARNRRIGVGFMGMQAWCAAHGLRLTEFATSELLMTKMVDYRIAARRAADALADALGHPRPIKVTAVAPVGTISQGPGTQPGLHAVLARYFVRRVRFADTDDAWRTHQANGFKVVDDTYAAKTKVVEFIVRDSVLDRFPEDLIEQSNEISPAQFFELVASVQETFCGHGDGQAVSATGSIPEGSDPGELASLIRQYLGSLKGITVFPEHTTFDLPPYEPLTREEFEERSEPVLTAPMSGDSNDGECVGGACPVR